MRKENFNETPLSCSYPLGKPDLSPEMAVKLSAVLGGSAKSWLRLQESYDLWQAEQKVDTKNLARIDFDEVT